MACAACALVARSMAPVRGPPNIHRKGKSDRLFYAFDYDAHATKKNARGRLAKTRNPPLIAQTAPVARPDPQPTALRKAGSAADRLAPVLVPRPEMAAGRERPVAELPSP